MNARIVCTLAVVLFPSLSHTVLAQTPGPEPVIAVSGSGSVSVPPDRVTVTMNVSDHAKRSQEAAEKSGKRADRIRTALHHLGIPDTAITIGNLDVQPGWDRKHDRQARDVLFAKYHIIVCVREIRMATAIAKTGFDSGADMIENIAFTASNTDSARQAALAQAVVQARTNAETIARAAGGTLGPMLQADTQEPYGSGPSCGLICAPMYRMAPGVQVPAIPGGMVVVNARVSSKWRFDK